MDVELQILKHLSRDAQPTVSFIDKYCKYYKSYLIFLMDNPAFLLLRYFGE